MRALFVLIFSLSISAPAFAQDRMEFFSELTNVIEDRIFPRLLDKLPRKEKKILRDIDFRLIKNPAVVTTVYTESDTKKVYIFAGFLDGLYNYVDCVLITRNGENGKPCNNYFLYYFDQVVVRKDRPPLSFAEIIFSDDENLDKWSKNDQINAAKNRYMISALIVIVMHEMGHHIVGFAGPNASISAHRKLEAKVDKWAIDRLVAMDENPLLGSAFSLGYLSQMERFRRVKGVNLLSKHPMPKERAEYTFHRVCNGETPASEAFACEMIKGLISNFE